jgi:hypothetical protein
MGLLGYCANAAPAAMQIVPADTNITNVNRLRIACIGFLNTTFDQLPMYLQASRPVNRAESSPSRELIPRIRRTEIAASNSQVKASIRIGVRGQF